MFDIVPPKKKMTENVLFKCSVLSKYRNDGWRVIYNAPIQNWYWCLKSLSMCIFIKTTDHNHRCQKEGGQMSCDTWSSLLWCDVKPVWLEVMTHFTRNRRNFHLVGSISSQCWRILDWKLKSRPINRSHGHTVLSVLGSTLSLFLCLSRLQMLCFKGPHRRPAALPSSQSAFCPQRKWCNRALPLEWSERQQGDSRRTACEEHGAVPWLLHVTHYHGSSRQMMSHWNFTPLENKVVVVLMHNGLSSPKVFCGISKHEIFRTFTLWGCWHLFASGSSYFIRQCHSKEEAKMQSSAVVADFPLLEFLKLLKAKSLTVFSKSLKNSTCFQYWDQSYGLTANSPAVLFGESSPSASCFSSLASKLLSVQAWFSMVCRLKQATFHRHVRTQRSPSTGHWFRSLCLGSMACCSELFSIRRLSHQGTDVKERLSRRRGNRVN